MASEDSQQIDCHCRCVHMGGINPALAWFQKGLLFGQPPSSDQVQCPTTAGEHSACSVSTYVACILLFASWADLLMSNRESSFTCFSQPARLMACATQWQ